MEFFLGVALNPLFGQFTSNFGLFAKPLKVFLGTVKFKNFLIINHEINAQGG